MIWPVTTALQQPSARPSEKHSLPRLGRGDWDGIPGSNGPAHTHFCIIITAGRWATEAYLNDRSNDIGAITVSLSLYCGLTAGDILCKCVCACVCVGKKEQTHIEQRQKKSEYDYRKLRDLLWKTRWEKVDKVLKRMQPERLRSSWSWCGQRRRKRKRETKR